VRVPLIVRHPDVRGGDLTEALAGSIDLVPTLLGFAGVDDAARAARYPGLHGVDLRPAIASARGRTARDERGILFNYTTPGGGLGPDGPASTGPGSQVRGMIRGVYDGRYKFGRYFKISEHHEPRDWDTLVAHNDLELYDTQADPDEIVNLAYGSAGAQKTKILELNAKVNALVDGEIGADDGAMYPGDTARYVLSA
jgi:arylsulfatase